MHRLSSHLLWLKASPRASAPALPNIVFPTAIVPLTGGRPSTAASQIPNLALSVRFPEITTPTLASGLMTLPPRRTLMDGTPPTREFVLAHLSRDHAGDVDPDTFAAEDILGDRDVRMRVRPGNRDGLEIVGSHILLNHRIPQGTGFRRQTGPLAHLGAVAAQTVLLDYGLLFSAALQLDTEFAGVLDHGPADPVTGVPLIGGDPDPCLRRGGVRRAGDGQAVDSHVSADRSTAPTITATSAGNGLPSGVRQSITGQQTSAPSTCAIERCPGAWGCIPEERCG